jgi:selenocysteine lyase/cysteine desulfurase
MEFSARSNRRDFLATLGAGSLGSMTWGGFGVAALQESTGTVTKTTASNTDYLFAPGLVYFGTAILGPCSRKVIEETVRAWYDLETNPTAMGYEGGPTLAAAERVRSRAAEFLGCATEEIVITRSTTDGMNAIAQGLRLTAGQRVLTSDQEHEGGSFCWEYLAHTQGIHIDRVRIPPGENDARAIVDRFTAAITKETGVISVSHVLTSTGLRMPVREITAAARSHDILCVVDGAQAVGGIEVNLKGLGCHAYATSGHKWLMGPKGTGLLYLASEIGSRIEPIQLNDGRSYYSESSGVGNLPGAIGLGVALESLSATGMAAVERHNLALRNRLYDGLRQITPVTMVSAPPGPLATPLITFTLPHDIDSLVLTNTLREKHRIVVKTVPKRWLNAIRLSPHIFNTEAEVDAVLGALRTELV